MHNIVTILGNPFLKKDFIIYCHLHENKENILFINDIDNFRKIENEKERVLKYIMIRDTYFTKDAVYLLNLNTTITNPILSPISSIRCTIFDQAYKEIIRLMQESVVPLYLNALSQKVIIDTKGTNPSFLERFSNFLISKTDKIKKTVSLYEYSKDSKIAEVKDKIKKQTSLYSYYINKSLLHTEEEK